MKISGGTLDLRDGTKYTKGDVIDVEEDVTKLKGALKRAVKVGQLIPVEFTMDAAPMARPQNVEPSVEKAKAVNYEEIPKKTRGRPPKVSAEKKLNITE